VRSSRSLVDHRQRHHPFACRYAFTSVRTNSCGSDSVRCFSRSRRHLLTGLNSSMCIPCCSWAVMLLSSSEPTTACSEDATVEFEVNVSDTKLHLATMPCWWQLLRPTVQFWTVDLVNPHTHYTSTNAAATTVYMTDGASKYMTGGIDSVTCKWLTPTSH